MNRKYLIIGSSAGGIGCALRLRMLDQEAEITVLTAESVLPYNKCWLADVLLGERDTGESFFCSPALLAEKKIQIIPNTTVCSIDGQGHTVVAMDGRSFTYDALCLATGRSPRRLSVFNSTDLKNLFNFYYKNDIDQIIAYVTVRKQCHAVVIGAGLTGLEVADGLRTRGCTVTILEAADHVLPYLANARGAQVIHEQIKTAGVQLYTGESVHGYESKHEHITALKTNNHGTIPVDLVVCAIGAEPNTDFLPTTIERINGYCIVNETLHSTVPDIYAVGDCCMMYDRLHKAYVPSNLWSDAMQQGMYAAYNMVGTEKRYTGTVQIASSGFFGLKVACAGPVAVSETATIKEEYGSGWYHRFVYDKDQLIRFMLIGNTGELASYRRQLMTNV